MTFCYDRQVRSSDRTGPIRHDPDVTGSAMPRCICPERVSDLLARSASKRRGAVTA
jgi:hypothetical protein